MRRELSSKEKRGPMAWMAGHSVAANLIMLLCLVGGLIAMANIKQEVFPDIERDQVEISVSYPGSSPEEIETGILMVIEEAVRAVDGVDEIYSTASEGSGRIVAELLLGEDRNKVANDIESEIAKIRTLPEDSEKPEVRVAGHRRDVLEVVLYGDVPFAVLHGLAERMRDKILEDPDVTQAEVENVPSMEIGVEIPIENLRRYGITLSQVADIIRRATVDLPGGSLKTDKGDVLVRMKERRDYGREFARIPIITTKTGSKITLADIAKVEDGYEELTHYTTYNGKRAISIEVYRVGSQTPLAVAGAVKRKIKEFEPELPEDIKIATWHDRSEVYGQRVELLLQNAALGLSLVLILLSLFLEIRLAFWVMMGIPISFLGAFLFLPWLGVTINMMSLFAFIIALGIVVDDAIVVGENVYHYRQEGYSAIPAAIKGVREVAMPVTFSISTNIAAFMPIYFIPGTMGKIFQSIPIVVCTVFIISLIESVFVLPAHLGHQKQGRMSGFFGWLHRRQQKFSHAFTRWVRRRFGPMLNFTLNHRYITLACAASILSLMLSYALSGRMRMELFPVMESDFAQAEIVLPFGSPVEKTEAAALKLIKGAEAVVAESGHPELVVAMITEIGRGGMHQARVRVEMADPEIRNEIMGTEEFTNRWREKTGEIPDIEYLKFASDSGGPGSHGRPIDVALHHSDIPVLEKASRELAAVVATYPGVKDVDDGFQPGKEQLDFTVKPEGRSLGLTASDIARQMRNAFYGAEVLRQQRGRNEIKILVRLPEETRASEQVLKDFMIATPSGAYVPLSDVAEMKRGRAYTSISRREGRRGINVSGDITPRSMAGEVLTGLAENELPDLTSKYPGLTYEFRGHRADMQESMSSLEISFIIAMLVIYAMLAIPFRSYVKPLVVMLAIPFGIVGAFLGHLIMDFDLCIPSMFGIVALAGVVVNDSLVMIAFATRREQEGVGVRDAIYSAAIQRFRPVMLTTLTTFAGLAPMIFETSRQARFLIPMALSLGFGILFATVITLIIIPSMYVVIGEWKHGIASVWRLLYPPLENGNSNTPQPESAIAE